MQQYRQKSVPSVPGYGSRPFVMSTLCKYSEKASTSTFGWRSPLKDDCPACNVLNSRQFHPSNIKPGIIELSIQYEDNITETIQRSVTNSSV